MRSGSNGKDSDEVVAPLLAAIKPANASIGKTIAAVWIHIGSILVGTGAAARRYNLDHTTPAALDALAACPDASVRMAITQDRFVSLLTLAKLVDDSEEEIAYRAMARIFGYLVTDVTYQEIAACSEEDFEQALALLGDGRAVRSMRTIAPHLDEAGLEQIIINIAEELISIRKAILAKYDISEEQNQ